MLQKRYIYGGSCIIPGMGKKEIQQILEGAAFKAGVLVGIPFLILAYLEV